jgi:hypothetical protein
LVLPSARTSGLVADGRGRAASVIALDSPTEGLVLVVSSPSLVFDV